MKFLIPKGTEVKRYNHTWDFEGGHPATKDNTPSETITTEVEVSYDEGDLRHRDLALMDDEQYANLHFKLPDRCFPWSYIEVGKDLVTMS